MWCVRYILYWHFKSMLMPLFIATYSKKFLLKTNLKKKKNHSGVWQASPHEAPVSHLWEQVHTQPKGEQVLLVHPTKQVPCHSEPVQFPPTCTLTMEQVQHHQDWQFNNPQIPHCPAPPSSTSPASWTDTMSVPEKAQNAPQTPITHAHSAP